MRYLIIGLIVAIVIVLIYVVVIKPKSNTGTPAVVPTTPAVDGTIQTLTGAGSSNVPGNNPAPPKQVVAMQNAAHPFLCQNKCATLHPFNRSKRNECISKCKTN